MDLSKVVEVMWDSDDGVLIIGDDIEVRASMGSEGTKLVEYLRSRGVVVRYVDREQEIDETR